MATRERPADRGARRGREITTRLLRELREARLSADLSLRAMGSGMGWSASAYGRFERGQVDTTFSDVSTAASLLGLELGAGLHPLGQPITDRGHQALIERICQVVAPKFVVFREGLFPHAGDLRSWDLLLRIAGQRIGLEAETRVRDVQRLVRHMRERERDGGVDVVILALADSQYNRAIVNELRGALGPDYATPPREILAALRSGRPVPGSGVILL